jgi:NAD(P)-dependent dehydrogenase (short-subunit alcohol dehydrogenase family)
VPLALITGGGSLIGQGIACALVARGWQVAVTDINLALAGKAADAAGGRPHAEGLPLDATDRGAVDAMVSTLLGRHGAIDALINAAGGMRGLRIQKADFADTTPDIWDRILAANFRSVLNCTHAVLPSMIAAKRGAIVSIAASRGLRGGPGAALYSAAKAAIIVFSQSLAQELGRHGIRVNTIAPGNAEARWKASDADERNPLGRGTTGADVGKAVAFLLSEDAGHITGSCLDLSGGTALH